MLIWCLPFFTVFFGIGLVIIGEESLEHQSVRGSNYDVNGETGHSLPYSSQGCDWREVHLLTFICVMWVGRSKIILFIFRNPVVFQQMSTQINTRHKARNFPYLEVQNKQQIEDRFGWVFQSSDIPGRFRSSSAGVKPHTMLTLSSHSQACVLAIGEKDAGSSGGADTAASGKTKNIPLWTTDVCLSCLPRGILPWTWDRPQLSAILCQRPQPPPWEHAADMQDDVLLISLPLSH